MRVLHPQLGRARVHPLDKRRLAPGDVLGKRRRAVVGRADDHALEHLIHAHLLADLQIDLTAALCRRSLRGRDHVVHRDPPLVERLHDEQQRHDLRHGRRGKTLVRVFFDQHRSGRRVHQDGRGRRNLDLDRRRMRQKRRQQRGGQQRCAYPFDHMNPILSRFGTSICPDGEKKTSPFPKNLLQW